MSEDNTQKMRVIEMYFEDGLKESEIAEAEGISELAVHAILAEYEETGASQVVDL